MSRMTDTLTKLSTMRVASHSPSLSQTQNGIAGERSEPTYTPVIANGFPHASGSTTPFITPPEVTANGDVNINAPLACTATLSRPTAVNSQDIRPENRCRIYLGEKELTFDKNQVPPPPMQHFSKSIDKLFNEWENSELLVINGQGIPVKYWDCIYKKRAGIPVALEGRAWDAVKVTWGNWKVQ